MFFALLVGTALALDFIPSNTGTISAEAPVAKQAPREKPVVDAAEPTDAKPRPSANQLTAENAQRFFAIATKDQLFYDKRFKLSPARQLTNGCELLPDQGGCWDGTFTPERIFNAQKTVRTSTIQSMTAPDVCVSNIVLRTQSAEITQRVWKRNIGDITYSKFWGRPPLITLALDWSKVSSAVATNGWLVITTSQLSDTGMSDTARSDSPQVEISFGDQDLATRAAFAAEVIRLRCDPLSSTGF